MKFLYIAILISLVLPNMEAQIMNHQLEKATQQGDFVVSGGGSFARVFTPPSAINLSSFNNDLSFVEDTDILNFSGGNVTGSGSINSSISLTIGNYEVEYNMLTTSLIFDAGVTLTGPSTDNYLLLSNSTGTSLPKITLGNMMKWYRAQIIPTGGATDQVLTKNSGTNYDYSWKTPSGGGGGGPVGIGSATASSSYTADFTSTNRLIKLTLTGNVTLTMTSGSTDYLAATLQVVQDGTGGRGITWPANIIFPGGLEPILSSGANDVDVFYFEWNGSDWVFMNALYDVK